MSIQRSHIFLLTPLLLCLALTAAAADYRAGNYDPWPYPDEDELDVMSYDDHLLASRLQRHVVGRGEVYNRRKASREHDSVTIVINENTTSSMTSSNDLKRNSSQNMTLTNWLTPRLFGVTQHGQMAGGNTPTITYSNDRAHKSDSSIDRGQYFTATLTGSVIQVLPNGFLVVEARKTVSVNGEAQTVTVTGIVNPAHMDSKSVINAEYLMDMSIVYSGKGPMTRMDKRGWAAQIIDFLNPF